MCFNEVFQAYRIRTSAAAQVHLTRKAVAPFRKNSTPRWADGVFQGPCPPAGGFIGGHFGAANAEAFS